MPETKRKARESRYPEGSALRVIEDLRRAGEPVVISVGGKVELVARDEDTLRMLWALADRIETHMAIREGLEDMKAGRGRPAEEVLQEIGRKYGLLPDA